MTALRIDPPQPVRDAAIRERSALVDALIRRADAYDADGQHLDARKPKGVHPVHRKDRLNSDDYRAIAAALRDIARDMGGPA